MEDALDAWVARMLLRRGWTVRILPYPGYGGQGWVRVLGRTVLAPPYVSDADLPDSGATGQSEDRRLADVRGWRSFLTAPLAGTRVKVAVDGREQWLVSDRAGYIDALLDADLAPGWQEVALSVAGTGPVKAPIQVVDAAARNGIVCDIDDTVMVTRLPRPMIAFWNAFVRRADAREAVPGMAALLRALVAVEPGTPVIYLSTGAWDAAPTLARFLRVNGYPQGTLLLTDWGPTNTGWFRSGTRHKVTQLRRIFRELPSVRWSLIGDDGQHDPRVYAGAVRHHTENVSAVLIRQLTFAEHVLSSGIGALEGVPRASSSRTIPVLEGSDGLALLAAARRAGLVS
jgi:phosphatidate phosphatase APP1